MGQKAHCLIKKKQLLKAAFLLIPFFYTSCQNSKQEVFLSEQLFEEKSGLLYFQNELFSGLLLDTASDGKIIFQYQYVDGLKDGEQLEYYHSGEKKSRRFYRKGFKVGVHHAWWENGKQKFVYPFNDKGNYQGNVMEWYPSGQLYKSFNFIDGQENGRQQLWKSDGRIKANYTVVDGERFGLVGLKRCYTVDGGDTLVLKDTILVN